MQLPRPQQQGALGPPPRGGGAAEGLAGRGGRRWGPAASVPGEPPEGVGGRGVAPGTPGPFCSPAHPAPLLQPQGAGGRAALYQVVAQHSYCARGPEDLALQRGDVVDVLCEGQWAAGARGDGASSHCLTRSEGP